MGRSANFQFPGRYDRVSEICDFVADGAGKAGFGEDDIFRIQLACDEACTNVIQHAYGGEGKGEIWVSWQYTDDAFIISIRDTGRSFDLENVPKPSMPSSPDDLDGLKIGGLGLHFMQTLMDEIHYTFDNHEGNKLVMVKKLPGGDER